MSNLYLYILHVVRAPCCCSDQIRPIRPTAVVWGGRARVTQTKCQPAGNVQVITEQAPLPPHSQGAIFYFYWNIYLPILITKHFLIILDSLIKKYFLVFVVTSCNISCVRSDPHIPLTLSRVSVCLSSRPDQTSAGQWHFNLALAKYLTLIQWHNHTMIIF